MTARRNPGAPKAAGSSEEDLLSEQTSLPSESWNVWQDENGPQLGLRSVTGGGVPSLGEKQPSATDDDEPEPIPGGVDLDDLFAEDVTGGKSPRGPQGPPILVVDPEERVT